MGDANSLREEEARDGARFESFGGLELPDRFADAMGECEAVRRAAGLFDLSFRGRLRVTGEDRTTFLHNLLSNDVAGLEPGSGTRAGILTEHSKVVSDTDVLCDADAVLLDLDARLLGRAREHLERYLVADEVEIEDRREMEATIGVHGPAAASILAPRLAESLPERPLDHRRTSIDGVEARIVRRSWTGAPGFDLVVPRAAAGGLWRTLRDSSAALVPVGMFAFNVLRLEAGIAWAGVDFDETTLALEAGIESAISFRKGCYLGQETIERVTARGKVNRLRVGMRLEDDRVPRRGDRVVHEGNEVGRVTSAAFSPTLESAIAMAIVKRAAAAPGTRLDIEIGGKTAPASVVVLPFVSS